MEVKSEPKAKEEPAAAAPLALELPDELVLKPGEVKYVLVKVSAKAPASLDAEPAVQFDGLGSLQCEPFTSSEIKAGAESYTQGYALRVAPTRLTGRRKSRSSSPWAR